MSVAYFFIYPSLVHAGQPAPPPPYPFIAFPLAGALVCYFAFFRSVTRVEIRDDTLYWYLPFHRERGRAPLANIVSLWTAQSLSWSVTRTVFVMEYTRPFSIRDQRGIKRFVAELATRSPEMSLDDWEPRESVWSIGISSAAAPRNDADGVVERRARAVALRRNGAGSSQQNTGHDPR